MSSADFEIMFHPGDVCTLKKKIQIGTISFSKGAAAIIIEGDNEVQDKYGSLVQLSQFLTCSLFLAGRRITAVVPRSYLQKIPLPVPK
jgi:hypothetical protein